MINAEYKIKNRQYGGFLFQLLLNLLGRLLLTIYLVRLQVCLKANRTQHRVLLIRQQSRLG